ncbi:uncharacterized protein [Watersipora subatra]|uniref:uncharacterized protein n=1 Tax=Watersipora subatra TaxID=2589382 RepID=UPI00355B7F64
MAESKCHKEESFVQRLDIKDENLAVSWQTFKRGFNILKIAKKYGDMEDEEQIANLLMLMGPERVPIYDQFLFYATEEGRTRTLNNVIRMFDAHFEPVQNIIYEQVKFNSLRQSSMSINQFITQVHTQADNCDYVNMRDQLIRDRIVVGVSDNKLREQLIDIEDLNLAACIRKAKQDVSHHAQASKLVGGQPDDNLDYVRQSSSARDWKKDQRTKEKCYFCNKEPHTKERGPAKGATCYVCKERGRWVRFKACKGKKLNRQNKTDEVIPESEDLRSLYLSSESE